MSLSSNHFQPLFDQNKKLLGVLLSPELWKMVENAVSPAIDSALEQLDHKTPKEQPEPLKDWETLKQYWDLTYPLPYDVFCSHCGSSTPNWLEDNPRLFKLRAANLGGLVNFECVKCQSRVIKKHFKKHVDVECRPFLTK